MNCNILRVLRTKYVVRLRNTIILIVTLMSLSLTAEAQYFKPDVEDGYGLWTYKTPNPNTPKSQRGEISNQHTVLVDSINQHGWCRINFTSKQSGRELQLWLRLKDLIPLDDKAREMKDNAVNITLNEKKVLTYAIILVLAGIITFFLKFLGALRRVLVIAILLALAALEFYFYFTTPWGFTFYSPWVVGWKWVLPGMLGLGLFILAQGALVYMALRSIKEDMTVVMAVPGISLILVVLAIIIAIFLPPKWGVSSDHIFIGFMAIQAVAAIFVAIHDRYKFTDAIMFILIFLAGIAPIAYMFIEMMLWIILAVVCTAIVGGIVGAWLGTPLKVVWNVVQQTWKVGY